VDVSSSQQQIAGLRSALSALVAEQQLALRLVTTDETVAWESLCAAALPSLDAGVVAGLRSRVALPLERFTKARESDRKALQDRRLDLVDQILDESSFARHEQHRHQVDRRLVDLRTRLKALRALPGFIERLDDVRHGKTLKVDAQQRVQEHESLQKEIAQLEAESARVANICARHRRSRLQLDDVDEQIRRVGEAALQDARRGLAEVLLQRGVGLEELFVDNDHAGPIAHRVRGLQARRQLLLRIGEHLDTTLAEMATVHTRLDSGDPFARTAAGAMLLELAPRIDGLVPRWKAGIEGALHANVDALITPGASDDEWWVALFPDVDALDEDPSTVALRRVAPGTVVDGAASRAVPAAPAADDNPDATFLPAFSGVFTRHGPVVPPESRPAARGGAFPRGTRLGRYVVEGLIGKGGMAEVYLAHQLGHADFRKRVVLKRMATDLRGIDDVDRMFAREAQTAARLNHPNIVQIFDYQAIDGEAFIVMEHLEGVTLLKLANLLRQAGQELPVPIVLRTIADAARGLHAAHTHGDERGQLTGLIHRDISPDNLFLTTSGFTKVLDFGIAKRDDLTTLTGKNELKGKIPYMAPEQIQSEVLDARADLFSLGATAYWLLCGERPFTGTNEVAVLHAVLTKLPPPVRVSRPDVNDGVEQFVLSLLSKHRNDRPPSAAVVARRCEQLGAATHDDVADFFANVR
jgi:hypothetical protein